MSNTQQPSVATITRYGLPFVVGVFYITASLGFGFTADSAFLTVSAMRDGINSSFYASASPLWRFLLMVGGWFHLDLLLATKILSLVFSCIAIVLTFLIVNEILRDRLVALLVSLILGMQGWLLQIAPSGSAIALTLVLVLAGLFFTLRNEYVIAPFIFGVCTLLVWQAVFLLIPVCIDVWLNSLSKRRAWQVILSAGLVYVCGLLPWIVFGWSGEMKDVPTLLLLSELSQLSMSAMSVLGILAVLMAAGLVISAKENRENLRIHLSVMMFMTVLVILGLVFGIQLWLAIVPLIILYSFFGLAEVLKHLQRERLLYSASFMMSGLLLVHSQLDYQTVTRKDMATAVSRSVETRVAAEWLKMNIPSSLSVSGEQPGIVAYYAERPITLFNNEESLNDIVVSTRREIPGYHVVFQPAGRSTAGAVPDAHVAVWRRK